MLIRPKSFLYWPIYWTKYRLVWFTEATFHAEIRINTCSLYLSLAGEGGIFVCLSPREKNTTEMILADLEWRIPYHMDFCYKLSVIVNRAHRV